MVTHTNQKHIHTQMICSPPFSSLCKFVLLCLSWAGNSWSLNFLRDKIWKIINSLGKTDDFIKMINSLSKTDDFLKIINSSNKTDDFTKTHKFSQ